MSTYKTQGIVLKKINYGENNQLFSLYTKDKGKIIALGRGTKKIQSKLNAHLEYFLVNQIMIASGRNFYQLANAKIIKNFHEIKKDLKKIILGSYFLELVNQLVKPEHKDEKLFDLLITTFQELEKSSNYPKIRDYFLFNFLTILGYKPTCSLTSKELDIFLKKHLDQELKSEKFLNLILGSQ